jgi:HEAT repeat protein
MRAKMAPIKPLGPVLSCDRKKVRGRVLSFPTRCALPFTPPYHHQMNYADFLTCLMKLSAKVFPRSRSKDEAFQRLLQDNILPLAGTVSQGPSGLAFYPGTGFGSQLRDTFLHCDFPGGIWSYTVQPRGASYAVASKSKFLWNCWPTDVDFGPDGAAYVLDWVAGWGQPMKGRIYRVTPETPPSAADLAISPEVRSILARGVADQAPDKLRALLAHPDRRVRLEGQFELARRGAGELPALIQLALGTHPSLARRHALWAIGQIVRAHPGTDLTRLLPLLESDDAKVQAVAARLLGDAGVMKAGNALTRLATESPDAAVRFAGAMGLGSLVGPEHRPSAEPTRKLVAANAGVDPFLIHAAVRHWVRLEQSTSTQPQTWPVSEPLQALTRDADPNVRVAATLALRSLRHPFLTNLLSDADPRVVIAAGRAIHDAPVVAGMPALAALLTRIDCPPALLSRSIDAAFRMGTAQHAQTLAQIAMNFHATVADPKVFPDIKESFRGYIDQMSFFMSADEIAFLHRKLESIPDADTCIHCDLHTSNIMIRAGEPVVIDMGDVSRGHYLFDIGLMATIYGVPELGICEMATKLPSDEGVRLYDHFIRHYFAHKTADELEFFQRHVHFLASLRLIYAITFAPRLKQQLAASIRKVLLPKMMASAAAS